MKPLVIYHGGCRDGFCAAWVAHLSMPGAEFRATNYGTSPPLTDVLDRDVYVIDFSYDLAGMLALAAAARRLVVLDHHKTAQAALAEFSMPNADVTFDMERSGAGLAWDHFLGGTRPRLVDYVEDRDLWRHKLPSSREVNAWISTLAFDFEAWDLAAMAELREMIAWGRVAQAKTDNYVREVKKNARRIVFEGNDVPIVNAPQVDISELLDSIAGGEAFAIGWWQRADGIFQYSLRSRGDFDVSELAKRHGGGGHKNAAGFQSATLIGGTP